MNDEESSFSKRKKAIEYIIDAYYKKCIFLKDMMPIDEAKSKALEMYLNSNLSLTEINRELEKIIKSKYEFFKKRYDKRNVEDNHREIYSRLNQFVRLLDEYI